MSRQKLARFQQNTLNPLIVEDGKPEYLSIAGKWRDKLENNNPLVVELACGRGEYTVGLAQEYTDKNFIGVDIKGSRIWKGASFALANGMKNVAFLRCYIQNLHQFFAEGEIDEIWITFPDPRPKDRDAKRRLTHPRFLEMYRSLLKPGGIVHLKTDNDGLYEFTKEVLAEQNLTIEADTIDLYNSPWAEDHKGIKTRYEGIFTAQGYKIKYLRFVN